MLLRFFYIYSSQQPSATRSSLFLSPGRLAETRGSVVRVDNGCLLGPINRSVGLIALLRSPQLSHKSHSPSPPSPLSTPSPLLMLILMSLLLALALQRIRPLSNDHPEDLATCKWSSGGSGHLQMIIWRDRPLANDHLEDLASCKWSSGGSGLLQMIIWRDWPLTNDHPSPPSP